jgi:hypothetical protein
LAAFFLEGVRTVSLEAGETARAIQSQREQHRIVLSKEFPGSANALVLLDQLFEHPIMNVNQVAELIHRSYPVANGLVRKFEVLGILEETTGLHRNRVFRFKPYLDLFQ